MKSKIQKSFLQKLWISLILLSYVCFSYYFFAGWWNSSIGTVLIILFSFLNWGKDFLKIIGLKLNCIIVIKSLFFAAIATICSLLVMAYIADKQNLTIQFLNWRDYYHDIFYILNEEIVLGALTLYLLVNKRKIKPIVASVGLAIFFSFMHYVFFRWIFADKGIIQIPTLITLFLIGFVRNNLILVKGHIGYSWALHIGWIVIMYSTVQIGMNEPYIFNTYLGSIEMLIISSVLAAISLIHWIKKVHPTTQSIL
ncbi:MAG: hypothetical protein NTY75_04130 [Candidatus Shapirobacteria bacterium]|nr:hypothetical protein [Candidatus Shapirobacteria bacterium]